MIMEKQNIQIIIADNHPLFCHGIEASVQDCHNGIEVVGQAGSEKELIQLLLKSKAQMLLLNYHLSERPCLKFLQNLLQKYPLLHILLIVDDIDLPTLEKIHKMGIGGFVSKTIPEYEMRTAIRYVADGDEFFSRSITEMLHRKSASLHPRQKAKNDIFTPREREIVVLCCEGLTALEIARQLNISFKTVVTHKYNIFRKLGIHAYGELVRYAIKNSIINA